MPAPHVLDGMPTPSLEIEITVPVPPQQCWQEDCTEAAVFIAADAAWDERTYACRCHLGMLLTRDTVWYVAAVRWVEGQIQIRGMDVWKSKRLDGAEPSDG